MHSRLNIYASVLHHDNDHQVTNYAIASLPSNPRPTGQKEEGALLQDHPAKFTSKTHQLTFPCTAINSVARNVGSGCL
jgi:hypothetical protein